MGTTYMHACIAICLACSYIPHHRLMTDSHFYLNFQVIFLIGNKSDLNAQRDVTYEEAKQFAEENGKIYCFMSFNVLDVANLVCIN